MQRMLRKAASIAELLFVNPAIFIKKLRGRMLLKLVHSPQGEVPLKIGDYTIMVLPSRNDWWKSMYVGCCGVEIEQNIKRYLLKSGNFIDVGAGVGYFSAIASGIVGASGQVHCFEPYPSMIRAIQRMINSNPNPNIILNAYALGMKESVDNYYIQRFDKHMTVSMVRNFVEKVDEIIEVRTRRLDTYLEQKKIDNVSLIKIDVEGYEYLVLKGLEGYFNKCSVKPPIIVEITPPNDTRGGYSLSDLQRFMGYYGYSAYSIHNPRGKEDVRYLRETKDVLFRAVH
ncbi:MAG: FkbM family methyltransferase [Endomicrobiales bacterium]